MRTLDWLLSFLPLAVVLVVGLMARRHVRSVADFLSANRSARRYLLAIAGGELQSGAVVFVAAFEQISHTGFTLNWWQWLSIPIALLLSISGFVSYRYRETRAMTLAQFFEIRYDRSFRFFTGLLGFLAGLFNFGIIPAVGSRCLVYFLGLPESVGWGGVTVPSYLPLMGILLSVTVFVALSGGVITVMVVNCIEGILSQVFYLVIIFTLLAMFNWRQISEVLGRQPPGHSLLNPFDALAIRDFNIWNVLMLIFLSVYSTMAWQNSSAYNSAALTPHEGRMGAVLGRWREMGKLAVVTLLGVCAFTYLHHPDFAAGAAHAEAMVRQIADPQAREQMETPVALAQLLPAGVRGLLCAVLLMAVFGGDATHLHSWGSIFIQDVILPLRKKPFTPAGHIFVLRASIVGVALFAFFFGMLFRQTEYISMWFQVTQAIFTGGAGSAIIGGLYWKKGTATGAWAAMVTGSALSIGGIILRQISGTGFPLNGVQISFGAALVAIAVYVIVSLLTCREDFNLQRMLHRGPYAMPLPGGTAPARQGTSWLGRLIGLDENFTRGDKRIAGALFGYSMIFLAIFAVGSVWNLIAPWPLATWSAFWHVVGVSLPVFFAVVTGIWFTWGGLRDIRSLFQLLARERTDARDDGTVVDHHNQDEGPRTQRARQPEWAEEKKG